MNRYTILSSLALLLIALALPVYTWFEPERMAQAQADLRQDLVNDAAVMYVENCAVCHGAAGEGIGATPTLDNGALRGADYDALYKVIARGRYGTAMAPWGASEGGIYTDYEIDALIALIRYVDWPEVGELAAAQGLIPPTLPVPAVDEAMLAQVAALGEAGSAWSDGIRLYASNCTVCHGINGEGTDLAPALNAPEVRAQAEADLARTILEGVPGTMMVGWDSALNSEEVSHIVAFLQNWDAVTAAGVALTPPEPIHIDLDDPDAVLALGQRIFDTTCVSCHGENGSGGTGPALNSQQVLTGNTDDQLAQAITNGGRRPNSTMPAFGDRLTSVEIGALVSYLRSWEPTAPWVENPRGTAQGGGPPWLRTATEGESPVAPQGGGQGAGQGAGGQGRGQGGPAWRDTTGVPPGQSGLAPEAGAGQTAPAGSPALSYRGTVVAVDDNLLTFQTDAGAQLQAMLGPPWFWSESGIALTPGDLIALEGFESTDHMEVNWLENLTTGARIALRTETGQPVWATGQ
jgi:mono/diheme cytochrome c family protein